MKKFLLAAGILGTAGCVVTSCAKKPEPPVAKSPEPPKPLVVEVVAERERSRYFEAVNRQLELGGTLYGYVEVDGDILKIADFLQNTLGKLAESQPQTPPFLKQDFAALFNDLGLTDIKAAGTSSVPDGTGYFRNRTYFHIPGKRRGLLRGLGGEPAPFVRTALAPANADAYFESEIDLPSAFSTVRDVVARVSGEQAAATFEAQLKRSGEDAAFSLYSFINGLKGRAALVMRFDSEKTLRLPAGPGNVIIFPGLSFLICIDGAAPALEPALKASPHFQLTPAGAVTLYEPVEPMPLDGMQPVLAVEGDSLYVSSSPQFLQECLTTGATGLAHRPEFTEALRHVGAEGNGLLYAHPRFFQQLARLKELNAHLPKESQQVLDLVLRSWPKPDRPLISVRRNLPDGILLTSYWNRSLKKDIAMLAVYNPATVGVLAAMAIPAFQKVRQASQEKAVLNNLRQLAAAADQHYLEHGTSTATYEDLVGPDKYIQQINPVGGEVYSNMVFKLGTPLRVQVPALKKIVEYQY